MAWLQLIQQLHNGSLKHKMWRIADSASGRFNRIMLMIPVFGAVEVMKADQICGPFGPAMHMVVVDFFARPSCTQKAYRSNSEPIEEESTLSVLKNVTEFMFQQTLIKGSCIPGNDSKTRQGNRRSLPELPDIHADQLNIFKFAE